MIGYLHVSSASHIHSQLFVYCRRVPSLLWLLLLVVFLLVASLWFWWCDYNRRHAGIMNHNFTVDMTRARHWRGTERDGGWSELGCRALWKIIMTKGKTFHSCDILVEHPLAWLFIKETYVECCCNNNNKSNNSNNNKNSNNNNNIKLHNTTIRKCSRAVSRISNWRRIKMRA